MTVLLKESYPFGRGLDFDMNVNMVLVVSNQLLFVNTHPLYELSSQLLGQIHIIISICILVIYYMNSLKRVLLFHEIFIIIPPL